MDDANAAEGPASASATLLLARAFHYAAGRHVGQRRKGEQQEPYINHLAEVAELVADATGGREPALVVAALLHDAIEDTAEWPAGVAALEAEVRDLFGAEVLAMVWECTDDKNLKKAERKRLQIEKAETKSRGARIVKLADKTSNVRSMLRSPPVNWPLERRREYLDWARAVVSGLRGVSPALEARFDEAATELEMALAT